MELVTLKITPLSPFVTPPKGDTIFGQILAYLFLDGDTTFQNYLNEKPKLIVSDMMPYGYLYKPTLPLDCFKSKDNDEVNKKELRKKNFISIKNLQNGDFHLCEKVDYLQKVANVKNKIDRLSFRTGIEDFAPYGMVEVTFIRELWIFILVESNIKDLIVNTIEKIGSYGFGKEANIGKGHFRVKEIKNNKFRNIDTDFYMSISPTILNDSNIKKVWYEPFTRFGKFGLKNAHRNAFKKPVIMADSSAVVMLERKEDYFGSCVNNGLKNKISHLQGYSIAIPIKIKDKKCLNIK